MIMLEAGCTRCKELFVPHGVEPWDLIHGVTEAGDDCGGIGVIAGMWIPPDHMVDSLTETWGRMVNLTVQEHHGLENPDCRDLGCVHHHPDRVITVEQAKDVLASVGWSTRDLESWNDDELIHFAREEKS